jgi:hypothetical protein
MTSSFYLGIIDESTADSIITGTVRNVSNIYAMPVPPIYLSIHVVPMRNTNSLITQRLHDRLVLPPLHKVQRSQGHGVVQAVPRPPRQEQAFRSPRGDLPHSRGLSASASAFTRPIPTFFFFFFPRFLAHPLHRYKKDKGHVFTSIKEVIAAKKKKYVSPRIHSYTAFLMF